MSLKYEVKSNEKLGRYLVAAKDLKPGERILSDQPFVLGPNSDTSLVCFNCYLPLISKFLVCKNCAVAPICPGDGCTDQFAKWHSQQECDFFRNLKLNKGTNPMTMVQNVGSLLVLRALLKKDFNHQEWQVFMELETHLDRRRESSVWDYYDNTVKLSFEEARIARVYALSALELLPELLRTLGTAHARVAAVWADLHTALRHPNSKQTARD